ncbi:hypothetical protein GWI33_015293 [Rhynchophorus ferrugineus]|uniref:Uncharacterized protein n=1 Tax=Rhynchophorus ferrugineus TaxID=354439 RepID=A0A834MBK1_RHYFE|nr:hypothetical protein GWI33_015293 [Rhynchophorus ferrugineus]
MYEGVFSIERKSFKNSPYVYHLPFDRGIRGNRVLVAILTGFIGVETPCLHKYVCAHVYVPVVSVAPARLRIEGVSLGAFHFARPTEFEHLSLYDSPIGRGLYP